MNCCVVPSGIVGMAGVTAIETRTAGVTLRVVEPTIDPEVAVTLVLPSATLVASPCPLTVAMVPFAVPQVVVLVRSRVLPSLYVPVAANCWVVPRANDGLRGVTAIDTSTGCPTLRVADAAIEPEFAVILAVPTPVPVASPLLAIVATVVRDVVQLTALLRSCLLPSL